MRRKVHRRFTNIGQGFDLNPYCNQDPRRRDAVLTRALVHLRLA